MNTKMSLAKITVIISVLVAVTFACTPQPPMKYNYLTIYGSTSDATESVYVGQTVTLAGEDKFYCADGDIEEYKWILPAEAYCISGSNTSELKCKFSPAGTYTIELQVKSSNDLWNTDYSTYPTYNRYLVTVTVSEVSGTWYVKSTGDDDNDGRSLAQAFATVQTAVDSAVDGDTVIISEGTYTQNINFRGKNITIQSQSPNDWETIRNTILQQSSVAFNGSETSDCKLQGLTISGNNYPSVDSANLQGHWEFDGDYTDSSTNGRDGTAVGSISFSSNGKIGQAATFNGSTDYVTASGYTGISGTGARTVSVWFKTSASVWTSGGNVSYNLPLVQWGHDATGQLWMIYLDPYRYACVAAYGGGVISSRPLNDGLWHNIIAIKEEGDPSSTDIKLYVDGQLDATPFAGTCTIDTDTTDMSVHIGAWKLTNGNISNYYQGQIDDVRIYSRALNEGEVTDLADEAGLVANWQMDGNVSDNSGNAITGSLIGDASWGDGYLGQALTLDGDGDYMQIPDNSALDFSATQSFTLSAWFKTSSNTLYQRIVQKYDSGVGYTILVNWGSTGSVHFFTFSGGTQYRAGVTGNYTDGKWHHVVGVRDVVNQELRIYVDGAESASADEVPRTLVNSDPFYIGCDFNATSGYFNGSIDEVKIYNRVLSDAELSYLYYLDGGIRGNGTQAALSNCIIKNKHTQTPGAGIFRFDGTISNCLLVDNTSDQQGGAFYGCDGQITNCTIVNNTASAGGGLYDCDGIIKNCIIWDNTNGQVDSSCAGTPTYSCIEGWGDDSTNHNIDPASGPGFVTFTNNDPNYRLDSDFDPLYPDYTDTPAPSPCIDAGDTESGYSNEPLPNGGRINMGIYGNTTEAEISPNSDNDGDGMTYYEEMKYSSEHDVSLSDDNPDCDDDGMPDKWEIDNGLNPDDASDGGQTDSDGDGLLNVDEYLYGTDPDDNSDADLDSIGKGIKNKDAIKAGLDLTSDNWSGPDAIYVEGYTWTQYYYPTTGGEPNEIVFVLNEDSSDPTKLVIEKLSEIHRVTDYLGRLVMERRLAAPDDENTTGIDIPGPENASLDDVAFTMYSVSGEVVSRFHKAVGHSYDGNPFTDTAEQYQAGDPNTGYYYDELGRLETVTDALGQKTEYDYDGFGKIETIASPGGRETVTLYDTANRPYRVTDPDGHYVETSYDSMGRAISHTQYQVPINTAICQQRWCYDNIGNIVRQVTLADPTETSDAVTCSPNTAVDLVTDYTRDYDDPAKTQYTYIYSETTLITSITQSVDDYEHGNNPHFFDYSGKGLPTYIVYGQASGQPKTIEKRVYDPTGRIAKVTKEQYKENGDMGLTQTTEYYFDDFGRLYQQIAKGATSQDDLTTTYYYDGLGRKTSAIDPKNITTQYVYDIMGHLSQKIENSTSTTQARTTTYYYNRLGNMISIVANDGTNDQATGYQYDLLGRVEYIDYPDDTYIDYAYYPSGKVQYRIQGDINSNSSVTTTYSYDGRGNLLSKYANNSDVHEVYTYDGRGLMKTAQKGDTGDYTNISNDIFTYNSLGCMTAVSQSIRGSTAKTISYSRNQFGQATQLTIPMSAAVTLDYTYTSLGQVNTITRNNETTALVDYSYKGTYVSTRSYPTPGVTFTAAYDAFGRIEHSTTVNGSDVGVDFGYAYDANGNITDQTYYHRSDTTINSFGYDDLNRLEEVDYLAGTAGTESFDYDLLGNRESLTDTRDSSSCSYAHNPANEYTSVCGTAISYDDAGNLMRDKSGYSYDYDYENHLTCIYIDVNADGDYDNGTDVLKATFAYDALGRRIEKVDSIAGTTKRFYYDDQRIALQTKVSSGIETDDRYFVYGNYIDEVLLMSIPGTASATDYYYGHDHLYSPVVLFAYSSNSQSWEPCERYEYDVYGSTRILAPDFSLLSSSIYGNPYTFTGRELDSIDNNALRLYYYRARSYDPQTGRFLQRDPLGTNPAGTIIYSNTAEAELSPINLFESDGNFGLMGNDVVLSTSSTSRLQWAYYRHRSYNPFMVRLMEDIPNYLFNVIRYRKDKLLLENYSIDLYIDISNNMNIYQYVNSQPMNTIDPLGLVANGCGAAGGAKYPDNPWYVGGADFLDACNNHDNCYAGEGPAGCCPKSDCDTAFANDLRSACDEKYPWNLGARIQCYAIAEIYHQAVVHGGQSAFNSARKNSWCNMCQPPVNPPTFGGIIGRFPQL